MSKSLFVELVYILKVLNNKTDYCTVEYLKIQAELLLKSPLITSGRLN